MSESPVREVTALAPVVPLPVGRVGMAEILFDPDRFAQVQRVAKMLIQSPLVPEHIRGKRPEEGMANIVMAIAMAQEMGENPIVVMQNIYFVSGKAGWLAQYMIAKAAKAGVFRGPIRWRSLGAGKDLAVTAYATLASTGETVEATADMKMAEAEGWTRNPKYKSMPEHMLKWRSATMLVRLYAPQVMLGYRTADELEDMRAAGTLPPAPKVVQSSSAALQDFFERPAEAEVVDEAGPIDIPAPEPEPEIHRTEAKGKTKKAGKADTDYLDPAHARALELIREGEDRGWLTSSAAQEAQEEADAARKALDLPALKALLGRLEQAQTTPVGA